MIFEPTYLVGNVCSKAMTESTSYPCLWYLHILSYETQESPSLSLSIVKILKPQNNHICVCACVSVV